MISQILEYRAIIKDNEGKNLLLQDLLTPIEVLELLYKEYPFERFNTFYTISYLVLNATTGSLIYSNAGHPPPVILRENGDLDLLKKGGPPIGTIDLLMPDEDAIPFQEENKQIYPGDKLLLYTDGLFEYQNNQGAFYSSDRFYKKLRELKSERVAAVVEKIIGSAMDFGRNTQAMDDVTLVGLEQIIA